MEGLGLQGSSERTLSTDGTRSNRMSHLIEALCKENIQIQIELVCILIQAFIALGHALYQE